MKFGKVEHPEQIDFSLPPNQEQTHNILHKVEPETWEDVRIGCAKWNKKDLKNFYPRGTKEELTYYSTQFNSIELNASFYRMWPHEQFQKWEEKTIENFKFFPKVPRLISHLKRLQDCDELVTDFTANLTGLHHKLGMVFLQMPDNFLPKDMDRLAPFFEKWPKEIPLSIEVRNENWFKDKKIEDDFNAILLKYNITNLITDSAGRRDLLHMRLTTPTAFIRYNGANHPSDYTRLDDWLDRIEDWYTHGLKNLYFFIHQNVEESSPLLSAYFIEKFNKRFSTKISIPKTL